MERMRADTVTWLNKGAATTVDNSRSIGCSGQAKLEQTQCLPLKGETVQGGHWGSVCLWRLASSVTPVWEPHILEVLCIFILWEGSYAFICITQEMINKMGEWRKWRNEKNEEERKNYRRLRKNLKRATDKPKRNVLRTYVKRLWNFKEQDIMKKARKGKHGI